LWLLLVRGCAPEVLAQRNSEFLEARFYSAAAAAFTPWLEDYDTWTGSTGHGALTCLIGTGPWIFTDWNQVAGVVALLANRPDAIWTGNPGYWAYWFLRDDMTFDGKVDLFDAVRLSSHAGWITLPH